MNKFLNYKSKNKTYIIECQKYFSKFSTVSLSKNQIATMSNFLLQARYDGK